MNDVFTVFQGFPVVAAYLFGSRGREEQAVDSDYDVGVLFDESVAAAAIADLKFSLLKELIRHLKKPLDLIVLNHKDVPLSLKFRIIKEGKIIYEQNELVRSRFETDVISFYLDRRYYHQRHISEVIENTAQGGLFD